MMPTSASPRPGPEAPIVTDSENHTNPSRNRNVMWIRMSTPNNLPAGNDQPLMQCVPLFPYSIHSFCRDLGSQSQSHAYHRRTLPQPPAEIPAWSRPCLLYTSDAADEE